MPRGWKWDPSPFHRKRWLEPPCKGGGAPCLHPCLLLCWGELCTHGGPRGSAQSSQRPCPGQLVGGGGHPSWMTVPRALTHVSRSL